MTLYVAIPDTSLTESSDLQQKTLKVGAIARALAIFRVDKIIIYNTRHLQMNQKRDTDLLLRLLEYMDTPQYLRKRIYPMSPSLKYAGLLPPLRTRSHPLNAKVTDMEDGMFRWGIQVRSGKVDLGLGQLIDFPKAISERTPTLFQISGTPPKIQLRIAKRSDVEEYWGFEVEATQNLVRTLTEAGNMTRIAFSRSAPIYNRLEDEIKSTVASTQSVFAIFGGPRLGVRELFSDEKHLVKEQVDFWVNTIPNQGTETVRLEEAVLISLGMLNNSIGSIITKQGYHQS